MLLLLLLLLLRWPRSTNADVRVSRQQDSRLLMIRGRATPNTRYCRYPPATEAIAARTTENMLMSPHLSPLTSLFESYKMFERYDGVMCRDCGYSSTTQPQPSRQTADLPPLASGKEYSRNHAGSTALAEEFARGDHIYWTSQ